MGLRTWFVNRFLPIRAATFDEFVVILQREGCTNVIGIPVMSHTYQNRCYYMYSRGEYVSYTPYGRKVMCTIQYPGGASDWSGWLIRSEIDNIERMAVLLSRLPLGISWKMVDKTEVEITEEVMRAKRAELGRIWR